MAELCRKASAGGGRRLRHPDPVGSRRRCDARADPEPAGDGRRAPSPRARRHAHQVRPADRNRRRARSAPRRAADRLRRRRGQSLPRLRDAGRSDRGRACCRHSAHAVDRQLHQGAQQGRAEGDVEDGDLDAAELLRRADLRSGRPRSRVRREVLHVDLVAPRRRRRQGDFGRSPPAPRARLRQQRRSQGTPSGVPHALESGGEYQWRRDGEVHLFNPDTVFKLQHATRTGQYSIFKDYTRLVDDQSQQRATLRGLFGFKPAGPPVPLDEVESIESILPRFSTGAMSYGSISQEAHETLAIAMNRMGAKSNTGEGGEDPARYVRDANGDSRRSAIKQVASGRFGVTSEYLVNADDLQIKMAQGAKPGEGGQLPGHKVYPWIAKVRLLDAGRRADLAAAASRHLLDRRSRPADLRSEERQPGGARARQARRRIRRRHGGRGRVEGARRRRADLRPRRRHRRVAAHQPEARRRAVGARPRRDAAGAADEPPPRPHRRAGRRPDEDRPRRRGRGAARRRGIRLCHRAARGDGLRDDARLPSQHLPGRHRDAGSRAAQDLRRQAGVRAELLPLHRRGSARADGGARVPHARRDDRPRRVPRLRARRRSTGRRRASTCRRSCTCPNVRDAPLYGRRAAWRAAPSASRTPGSTRVLDRTLIAQAQPALEHQRAGRVVVCRFATPIAPPAPCSATR